MIEYQSESPHALIEQKASAELASLQLQITSIETRINKAKDVIVVNTANHAERQKEIDALTTSYNIAHEAAYQAETAYNLAKGTSKEQDLLAKLDDALLASKEAYDTMISRCKQLADCHRADNHTIEGLKAQLAEDERGLNDLLQQRARLEQARQQAQQEHGQELFKQYDLALRGNRDRREALNQALIDCNDTRDDILAHARHELKDFPEHLSAIVDAYGPAYHDAVIEVLEANLHYRKALAKVESILHFVGLNNIPMLWLEVQPSEDMGMRNHLNGDIEEFLQLYKDIHSHM